MPDTVDKLIGKLAEIITKNDLAELEYESENCRISLIKSRAPIVSSVAAPAMAVAQAPASIAAPAAAAVAAAEDTAAPAQDLSKLAGCVKSPMVGVVYLSSNPTSPNYVKVGDNVSEGDTVCLIEAMKTFNPVKAHTSGKVTKILIESGNPVEYGEPLIVIE